MRFTASRRASVLVTSVFSLALNPLFSYLFTKVFGFRIYRCPSCVLNSFDGHLTDGFIPCSYQGRDHIECFVLLAPDCVLHTAVIVALAINTIPLNDE